MPIPQMRIGARMRDPHPRARPPALARSRARTCDARARAPVGIVHTPSARARARAAKHRVKRAADRTASTAQRISFAKDESDTVAKLNGTYKPRQKKERVRPDPEKGACAACATDMSARRRREHA